MKKAQNIFIAGFGDIGKRLAQRLSIDRHYQVKALVRKTSSLSRDKNLAKKIGVQLVRGDLSSLRSLQKFPGPADTILHFAPPPGTGRSDTHTKHFLAALDAIRLRTRGSSEKTAGTRRPMLPRRIVYISTTGVYGNCEGAWLDETRPTKPETARAKRRVDAEKRLQKWGRMHITAITILRAPGIYANDRLPLDRLRRRMPVLLAAEDVFTNHIHADDLTTAAILAIRQPRPKKFRIFNVVDDSHMPMGDYFDQVADAFGLSRSPRISRLEAEGQVAPMLLSFMRESRRIGNSRVKRELKLVLKYPTLSSVLKILRPQTERGTD